MNSEQAHKLAGDYGLELPYRQPSKCRALHRPGITDSNEIVWISPQELSHLTSDAFVCHHVRTVLEWLGQSSTDAD